jgi:hypothetical protein
VGLIHRIASNEATAEDKRLFKNKVEHDTTFHGDVLNRMKKYDEEGFQRKRRYLNTALNKCDQAKRRSTDPRKEKANMEDLKDAFNRVLDRSLLTRDQLEADRVARFRIDLISCVASNTATTDQMQSFEKILQREIDFRQQARGQLRKYVEQKAEEDADRLYSALARVLVERKPLPPHGPVLIRGEVLGAGSRYGSSAGPSAEEMERDWKWHPIATGTATDDETRIFQHEILTNKDFLDAVQIACHLYESHASEWEQGMYTRLMDALKQCSNVYKAIRTEAMSNVGGDPNAEPSGGSVPGANSSPGVAFGRGDQAPRDLARGASSSQSPALPAEWTAIFIDIIANRMALQAMLRLFQHKFQTENAFQHQVVTQFRKCCSLKSTSGYEKAVYLRFVALSGSPQSRHLFHRGDDDRLEQMRQLCLDRQGQLDHGSYMMPSASALTGPDRTVPALRRARRSAKSQATAEKSQPKPIRISMPVREGEHDPCANVNEYLRGVGGVLLPPPEAIAASSSASHQGPNSSQPRNPKAGAKTTKNSKRK